jgi:hypothetical protein
MLVTPLLALALVTLPPDGSPSRYLEVPLRGEFGKEITAPGVRDAIRVAKTRKCDCVVFVIDSPGGRVMDGQAIARVMEQERSGLKYYAVIVQAMSASVWPLCHMDRIFFTPASAAGAAVAFKESASTGQIEVDAKFNAAMAADVSSAADAHGQSGCVYRAMIIKDARLFKWRTPDGTLHLGAEAPTGDATGVEEVDNQNTVLAWTAQQACDCGFGTMMPSGDVASLGKLLESKEWASGGDPASQAMVKAKNEVERALKSHEDAKAKIPTSRKMVADVAEHIANQVTAARNADPRKVVTVYYRETGTLTAESQVKWRDQSDAAMRKWNEVRSLLPDLEKAERRATQAVTDYNAAIAREWQTRLYDGKPDPLKLEPVDHGLDVLSIQKEADDTLRRLNAERVKSRV